jgi:DNA-binding SARP family transcriptional activator
VLDYQILGPLEVVDGDRSIALGGIRARALLAVLAVSANRSVSNAILIDEVWAGRAPSTAANVVQGHVSDLRRLLGRDAIETRDEGYRLVVPRAARDLDRFEQLAAEGSESLAAGDPARAAESFGRALALWRGPALAEIAAEGTLVAEALRLDELRMGALERRIEADLGCGRHREVIAELQALVAVHPYREPLRENLALALYRAGRSVEALDVLREARRALAEGLGLDSGPALQELERSILRHDPALAAPEGRSRTGTPPPPQRAVMAATLHGGPVAGLTELGAATAAISGRELIVTVLVDRAEALGEATGGLNVLRDRLLADGLAARSAAFTSTDPAADLTRLLRNHDVDLLLLEARPELLADADARAILDSAPCDVGLLVGTPGDGPVMVPFSGAEDDWAAVELGAWLASARRSRLCLAGSAGQAAGRDASRLLASASLAVQRAVGVAAEPVLVAPDPDALAAAAVTMGLVVVGLPDRWRRAGLGPARTALVGRPGGATLLVRRGLRPGGLAPANAETRFTWTMQP